MDKITKSFDITVKDGGSSFEWEGYASQYGNIDSAGDVIEAGAFSEQVGKTVEAFFEHQDSVGKIQLLKEDAHGLVVRGKLFDDAILDGTKNAQLNKRMRELMKSDDGFGAVSYSMSVGFYVKQSRVGKQDGQSVRFIEKGDLVEVSLVKRPANTGAVITSTKGFDCIDFSNKVDIIKGLAEIGLSGNQLSQLEGFLAKNESDLKEAKALIALQQSIINLIKGGLNV
jgi:HK97 family phage prohead protease